MPLNFLCLASCFKGNRFLEQCRADGHGVVLLTIEPLLGEKWAWHACDEVQAVPSFQDRRRLVQTVAGLMRSRRIDRVIALDDFDVEVAAHLREHFRLTHTGLGESQARLFRDKLAMRVRARELGLRVPEFCPLFHDQAINDFLARVPGPWLVKPRQEASAAGIRTVYTPEQVWQRLHELGDERSFHLIEQFVPGELYHVDALTASGRVVFAEVNAYRRPLLEVYQGGGIYATRTVPRDRPDVAELKQLNATLLSGFGLDWGASHTEFMRSHADGQFYFIETSARVGGANTAEMVEHAAGVNLWAEWARLEAARGTDAYRLPPRLDRYAGVVASLARQPWPDTSGFTDPEIVYRLEKEYHIGFVVAADTPERVEELLTAYTDRIARDYHAVLPPADKVSP